jgi:hypothetical protein
LKVLVLNNAKSRSQSQLLIDFVFFNNCNNEPVHF